jgi:hypothetical protein
MTAGEQLITPASEIRRYFAQERKRVISFAGFAELGYEDPTVVARVAQEVLDPHRPEDIVVNSGTLLRVGGENGIAEIYELAKERGIATTGIHPSVALSFADTHRVSPCVDRAFFVVDETWGGLLPSGKPSATLAVILDVTDELIVVGGGKHAADELLAFSKNRKAVRYFPARMNRRATEDWCRRSGARIAGFDGAAFDVWSGIAANSHEPLG